MYIFSLPVCSPFFSKTNLTHTISKIEPTNEPDKYLELSEILGKWVLIAKKKLCESEASEESMDDRKLFGAVREMSVMIYEMIRGNSPIAPSPVYVFTDLKGSVQGMMVLQNKVDETYIAGVTTNPLNIRSRLNVDEDKRNGVGRALLQKAEHVALSESNEFVRALVVPTAAPFFEKMGFERLEEDKGSGIMESARVVRMEKRVSYMGPSFMYA